MNDDDFRFMSDKRRAFLQEPHKLSSVTLKIITLFLVIGFIWAYFAPLEERTSALGKVIPSSQVQDIQNLEGGILADLFVREGDIVDQGEILLKIDDTRFASAFQESESKYYTLLAQKSRLEAEAKGASAVVFPDVLEKNYPELIRNQTELFKSNRANQKANIDTLKQNYEINLRQLAMTEPLAEEGIVSQIELLRQQKEVNEAKGKIEIQIQTYHSNVNEELADVKGELESLAKALDGLEDRMKRTTISSPVRGIVNKIDIDTIGGVIQPGQVIMEIVPLEDNLLIEARISPEKIAFISPGQVADVKITAYDPSIYGSLKGRVKHISADTIIEPNEFGVEESYFKVLVETNENFLEYDGERLPIIPGMQVTADVITGRKTVFQYLIKPFVKARQKALTER